MEPGLIGTKLASAVVTPLIRKLFVSEPPGAGLVDKPLRISSYVSFHGEKRTLDEADLRKLAHRLVKEALRCGERPVPADEEQAVADALARTLHALGDLALSDAEAVDLGHAALARELRRAGDHPERHLSADATHFYERLLDTTCLHILNFLTQRSTFVASTLVHQTRRQSELVSKMDELIARTPRPDSADATFEQRYLAHLAIKHGKLTIYGIDLTNSPRKWPLDAAYLSLEVTGRVSVRWHTAGSGKTARYTYAPPQFAFEPRPAAQALADHERVLLRGEAGSGKTTLIQWLALSAARQDLDGHTAEHHTTHGRATYLQDRIPFVLPLRTLTRHGERLPAPKDFLAAVGCSPAGEQPSGWESRVLKARRGIVLVDGIDEIPDAERAATRAWLGDLIEAYPGNRWLVTSRPSAVQDDWLADEEFTELTLCPMSPADVAAFIRRWHDAARTGAEDDDAELTAYESQLLEAVRAKPDLGRLATNPLMCGLICALHRDRRGFLPYGRKDLYDAALSMLLIRRDRERDMRVPERRQEPQIQLLQQLAYWLIRNGRTEMDRSRAESVIADLLPSVRELAELGDAPAVYEHFLHRSGLLREPAPGTVDFIHRTFQDYLGARAAVEAGDFGLLVEHSADDQWEDVVRMAVAHARPRERVELFTELIEFGDTTSSGESVRTRVHLLAATCLEHAAELDPAVRAEVERRTAGLIPPRSYEAARALAQAGPLILGLLPGPEGLDRKTAELVVTAASHVASERAIPFLARFCHHPSTAVRAQLIWAWGRFDTRQYADEVIARIDPEGVYFSVTSDEQLEALRELGTRPMLDARGDISAQALSAYAAEASLTRVRVMENPALEDLSFLARPHPLTYLRVHDCPRLADLSHLRDKPLREVTLSGIGHADAAPLSTLGLLRGLSLVGPPTLGMPDLPAGGSLKFLDLSRSAVDGLHGLADGRAGLAKLYLGDRSSPKDEAEWAETARLPALRTLQVVGASLAAAPPGLSLPSVFQVSLVDRVPAAALARIAELFPRLQVLILNSMLHQTYDLRQLRVPSTLLRIRLPVGARKVYGLSQLPEDVEVLGISMPSSGAGAS